MADGLAWDDLTPELEGPYVEITRSKDDDVLTAHCKRVMSG